MKELALLVQGVEGGDHRAGVNDALEGDHVFRDVRRKDGDAVSLLDALILEESPHAPSGLPDLGEGVGGAVHVDEGRLVLKAIR